MSCIKTRLLPTIVAITFCQILSSGQVQQGPRQSISLAIHGQVRFTEGGAPAANVLVRLESYDSGGSLREVFTDSSGKFRFSGLSPAQYTVRLRQSGYRETQQQVDLQTASSGYVILQLMRDISRPSSVSPGNGTVDANVPPAAQREFDKALTALADRNEENLSEAVRHFERAVAIYPRFVEARLRLGAAYMDLEDWNHAEQTYRATLEIDPKAANALFALGEVYLQQNRNQNAEKVLLQGLQIDDRSYLGHLNLARVYWERVRNLKDTAQAKPALEKSYDEVRRALQLNSNLAGAYLLKGNLLLRASRTTEALKEFAEYLRLEPKGRLADETRGVVDKIKKATAHYSSGSD